MYGIRMISAATIVMNAVLRLVFKIEKHIIKAAILMATPRP